MPKSERLPVRLEGEGEVAGFQYLLPPQATDFLVGSEGGGITVLTRGLLVPVSKLVFVTSFLGITYSRWIDIRRDHSIGFLGPVQKNYRIPKYWSKASVYVLETRTPFRLKTDFFSRGIPRRTPLVLNFVLKIETAIIGVCLIKGSRSVTVPAASLIGKRAKMSQSRI